MTKILIAALAVLVVATAAQALMEDWGYGTADQMQEDIAVRKKDLRRLQEEGYKDYKLHWAYCPVPNEKYVWAWELTNGRSAVDKVAEINASVWCHGCSRPVKFQVFDPTDSPNDNRVYWADCCINGVCYQMTKQACKARRGKETEGCKGCGPSH